MIKFISHGIIVLAFDNTVISNFGEMGFHIHLVEDKSLDALKKKDLRLKTLKNKNNFFSQERSYSIYKTFRIILAKFRSFKEY